MRPFFSQESRGEILEGIDRILESGRLMMGDNTAEFESRFAEFIGTEFAISTNSCTSALQICLQYMGANEKEVLVPSGTFRSAISSIKWSGATPVLVDMNPETLSFDVTDLKQKITPRTAGIMWVHLTGTISHEYPAIQQIARDNDLFLLEDCAHAHGATAGAHKAGSIGNAGCFSFYPTKLMTTGSGGMITTNDPKLAKYAKALRLFGQDPETGESIAEGNDWFLDEIGACIGVQQLKELPKILERRREIASQYSNALSNTAGIRLLEPSEGFSSAYYQYPVFLDSTINRNDLIASMRQKHGIECKEIYEPNHQLEIFSDLDDGTLKKTEEVLGSALCLPMFYGLTNEEIDIVIAALKTELTEALSPS